MRRPEWKSDLEESFIILLEAKIKEPSKFIKDEYVHHGVKHMVRAITVLYNKLRENTGESVASPRATSSTVM